MLVLHKIERLNPLDKFSVSSETIETFSKKYVQEKVKFLPQEMQNERFSLSEA